ncbi:putative non-specific lipid-transfer protein-like protein [Cocos nucifera]|uniref:Putative non-specific lipid-transfer protein-like protein n=1 Tax=Cocos nucifera TaxID=13894 RepID=A0A8K0MXZ1_COCNU|nr:putative non-specific lipid-transfer protein-like protein [Cocos nucifera]
MRQKKMVSNIVIGLLVWILVGPSLAQPSNSSDCKVPPDLSSCGEDLEGGAPKPSVLCCGNLTLAFQASDPRCLCHAPHGGASFAVNKGRAPSLADDCKLEAHALGPCYDGSGMTESPAESPKDMRSSSNRSINTQGICPGCETRPSNYIPSPP